FKKRRAAHFAERPTLSVVGLQVSNFLVTGSAGFTHAFGDDPDLLDPGTLRGVDDLDDGPVPETACSDDEHRLVLALIVDGTEPRFQFEERHVALVDRDLLVG